MKHQAKTLRSLVVALAALVFVTGIASRVTAQTQDPSNAETAPQPQRQANRDQMPNLADLNLTPDQIRRIRLMYAEMNEQQREANMRLRLAKRALDEAMESPAQDETLIEQRSREFADANAAHIRLRTMREFRLRQILTAEQRVRLTEMQTIWNQENRRRQQQRAENLQKRQDRRGNSFRERFGLRGVNPNRMPPAPQQRKP